MSSAAAETPSRSKLKLAKYRHYDSVLLHLVTIALAFFLLFQNQKLKEEIRSQAIDEVIEDLLQEKLTPILKELEDLRAHVS